jgi:hypothetical protein
MCGILGIMGHNAGVRTRADARKLRYTTLQSSAPARKGAAFDSGTYSDRSTTVRRWGGSLTMGNPKNSVKSGMLRFE